MESGVPTRPGADGRIAIRLEGVEKSFGGQRVLRGVDLAVAEGSTVVLVGPSGGGKSVILKHMLGLMKPDAGRVSVLGQDLARLGWRALRDLRRAFGVLFQNGALFDSLTIYDNVALPLRERTKQPEDQIRQVVEEKLALMHLAGSGDKYPAQVSGGMQKRVALARALVLNPRIVFFDEPTSGLDVSRSQEIYRLFHETQARLGYTAVIVSHDVPKIFKLADRVALLADGRVQAFLSPEAFQLSADPTVRAFVKITMGAVYVSELEEGRANEAV